MPSLSAWRCQRCDAALETRRQHCETCRAAVLPTRASARARGYTRRWEHVRRSFLQQYPLCGDRPGPPTGDSQCQRDGWLVPGQHVDHIVPVRQALDRLYDWENLQSLCASCHSKKTARGL